MALLKTDMSGKQGTTIHTICGSGYNSNVFQMKILSNWQFISRDHGMITPRVFFFFFLMKQDSKCKHEPFSSWDKSLSQGTKEWDDGGGNYYIMNKAKT